MTGSSREREGNMGNRQAREAEALARARGGESWGNYAQVIEGFVKRGIPEVDIRPRDNVLTYDAWRALGRQVRRGEHGVTLTVFIPVERKERDAETGEEKVRKGTRPWITHVFHESQLNPA